MDRLFVELIGKPKLSSTPRIITIIAENFSLLDDQAKFLKATLAIPTEKQLPLGKVGKRLIQLGPLHGEILVQLEKAEWTVTRYDQTRCESSSDEKKGICDRINGDITTVTERSLIIVNDASRLQLMIDDKKQLRRFLRMIDCWKRVSHHFVVMLYQQSQPESTDTFLRDLESLSDACIRVRSFKSCYMMSIWHQPLATVKTLIPPKIETDYCTCKIGKSFWSADLLCFYERVQVSKNFDPDLNDSIVNNTAPKSGDSNSKSGKTDTKEDEDDGPESALRRLGLNVGAADVDEEQDAGPNSSTLPYLRAQNPEQSRIFYYPDKDDDVDEDDPDDDLGI